MPTRRQRVRYPRQSINQPPSWQREKNLTIGFVSVQIPFLLPIFNRLYLGRVG